ncbi:MAG: SDR family NAD(P)-dependent oxidoreductase [Bacteroidales bacterium]|nr:SDR family NAD(P)-dependent oxidoreductase [Bacteroidales bacterium]
MKKIVISGASSGIGYEVAKLYISAGWQVVVAARRADRLQNLVSLAPDRVSAVALDVVADNAPDIVSSMLGGNKKADVYFHVAGIGHNNIPLNLKTEVDTVNTNAKGFVQCVATAFNFFRDNGGGHIAIVSSIAGTKGLGSAPSYSATKRMQSHYIQSLARLSKMSKANISFTDIRPGFIETDLLADGNNYPMKLALDYSAKRIFKALNRKRRKAIIDWKYWFLVQFWKCIPNWLWERLPWNL